MGDGNYHIFLGDQIFKAEIKLPFKNNGTPFITVFLQYLFQFLTNNTHQTNRVRKNFQQGPHRAKNFFIFLCQFFLLKPGQPVQTHIENFLGLHR